MKPDSKKLDPGHIVRSLDRSDMRSEISLKLFEKYPEGMTSKELSLEMGRDEMNVIGALTGYDERYSARDALVKIGLATMKTEKRYGGEFTIFTAVSNGEDVLLLLSNYARQNDAPEDFREYIRQLEAIIAKKNDGRT